MRLSFRSIGLIFYGYYNIMSVEQFNTPLCNGTIQTDQNGWNITVTGTCNVPAPHVRYAAAAPADFRMARAGSGLPYACEDMAFEGSPNVGEVPLTDGQFSFNIVCPNSYYVENGSRLVGPHVHFTIGDEYFKIPLNNALTHKYRSLTSRPGTTSRISRR